MYTARPVDRDAARCILQIVKGTGARIHCFSCEKRPTSAAEVRTGHGWEAECDAVSLA